MKKQLLLLCILSFLLTTCKKKIIESEHKNTGRNFAYLEFDGHKYLFKKKSFTFYKNIKGKFKSGEDNASGLKPVLDLHGDRFNFQGLILRTDGYRKKKSNIENQVDGIAFNINAVKDASGNWVCSTDIASQSTINFIYYLNYKSLNQMENECNAI